MPKTADKSSVQLSGTIRSDLLAVAESEDSQSRDEEDDVAPAPAVMEETDTRGSADRIGAEVIDHWKNVRVDGGQVKVLSQEGPQTIEKSKRGVEQEAKKKGPMKGRRRHRSIGTDV